MRTIDYDATEKGTGGTETHRAVDEVMQERIAHEGSEYLAFVEGFAAASGVLPEAAETGGRLRQGGRTDASLPDRASAPIEQENPGLADN